MVYGNVVTMTASTTSAATSNQIWTIWNADYSLSTATAATITGSTSNVLTWNAWNQQYATTTITNTASTTNTVIWTNWNLAHGSGAVSVPNNIRSLRQPTQAELQASLARERAARERAEVQLVEERAAREKAELLLKQHLSEQQVRDLEANNFFDVDVFSKDGTRRKYRIKRGFAGNIKLLNENGREIRSYCIHPSARVPDADAMLAQKLLLENDELLFLKTANETRLAS
jgi:hypothetical protein